MAERTIIISDTHLGDTVKTAGPVPRFEKLLQGADRLIINGDGFEFDDPRRRPDAMQAHDQLHALCRRLSVSLTTLSGNHDAVDEWPRSLELLDGRVLLSHGDAFHPGISPWCSVAAELAKANHDALTMLRGRGEPDSLETLLAAAHIANKTEIHRELAAQGRPAKRTSILGLLKSPGKVLTLLNYWRIIPDMAARLALQHRPRARVVLFGHTHHQGVWRRRGLWVVNTGAYRFPGRPLVCILQGTRLSVHRLILVNNAYMPANDERKPLLDIDLEHYSKN